MLHLLNAVTLASLASGTQVAGPEAAPSSEQSAKTQLTATQVFALADAARAERDYAAAEASYRALSQDPNLEIRTEARFRLGMMLANDLKRWSDAAIEFRRILDDKPGAARVRLELARMHTHLGNLSAARKELRAAQASGLPPAVEQLVRFYSRALNARKPIGGSIELAIAPDTNINRATRSSTVGTVIGDFALDEEARARSGVGINVQGQGYVRHGIEPGTDLLVRASGSGALYRDGDFNDVTFSLLAGPQYSWGGDQLTFSFGPTWRWYGGDPFSTSVGGIVNWQHPTGKRSQIRIEGGIAHTSNKRNRLQTAEAYTLSATLDRALGARMGAGLQLVGFREAARDPGYALTGGGASLYLFREMGRTTLLASLGFNHLEADARLLLFPERRVENRFSAAIAATVRALRIGSFAPLVRLRWERNRSTLDIYDYRRLAAEFGVTSAF